MDASNRYVMMCQKAGEIQQLWQPNQCDFIIHYDDLEEGVSFCRPAESLVQVVNMYYTKDDGDYYVQECEELKEQALWLPRQNQLQSIMEPNNERVHSLIRKVVDEHYHDFSKNSMAAAHELFYSMEQLWLAYIMKEKFHKVWNEQEWVTS